MSPQKKTDNSVITGVIYARYSSHMQKEESIEQQIEECTAFAQANGITIKKIYSDKAISGRTDKRTEFQRMMRDAEKKLFQVVIAYKSNRIARNMLNALQYEAKLDLFGIRTLYAKEEFGNTAAGRFALRTMMNVNQFYSENMAEDIKRGLHDNAENLKANGMLPLGYKKGADGRFAVNEEEAAVVREIFSKVADGVPYIDVINSLNARGIKTRRGTAVRLGAEVTVAYRRKESDMPADPAEVAEAKEDGVTFVFEHKPLAVEGADGKVTALICDQGKLDCDTLIIAVGQVCDWGSLDVGELKTDAKGRAQADAFTYQSAQPDIFVGGDVFTGAKFAIDAIAAGKQGAISIHRFVQEGQSLTLGRDRLEYTALDKDNVDFDAVCESYDNSPRQTPLKALPKKDEHFRDLRQTFTEEQLKAETARCLGCGASVVDPNKCLGCGVCTTRCKFDAIHLRKRTYVESIPYPARPEVLPQFIADRQRKIDIKRMQ